MDLNYLYQRQQLSLMQADATASPVDRAAYQGRAAAYGKLIEDTRRSGGLPDSIGGASYSLASHPAH